MVDLITQKLTDNEIKFHLGYYNGLKEVCVIVSQNLGFLTTL